MREAHLYGWAGRILALSAFLVAGTVGAATTITGNMDLMPVPAAQNLPCLTFGGLPGGAAPSSNAPSAPGSPEMAEMQKQLAEMQAELQKMTPGSAEYNQMKQALDMAKSAMGAVGTPRPGAPTGKATAYKELNVKQALANLYKSLAYEVSPKAWQSFQQASALNDPNKARAAATVAVVRGKPLAAVAAYLKVLEKNPKDADALYNLGALAAFLSAPNEALALLAAAEANGGPKGGFYPAKAQLQSTRGYALMQVGKSTDAEKALREAVKLAPNLVEANRNLAAALGNQGKCAESKKILAAAFRRDARAPTKNPAPDQVPAPTTPQGVPSPVPPAQANKQQETIVLVRDTLDFTRGKVGKWPYFPEQVEPEEEAKLERMIAEYQGWVDRYSAQESDFQKNYDYTLDSSQYIINLARTHPLAHTRAFLLWEAVRQYYFYPRRDNLDAMQAQAKAQARYFQGEADSGQQLARKIKNSQDIRHGVEQGCSKASDVTYCMKKAEYDDMSRQCEAVKGWNNLWRGAISGLETPTRKDVAELDRWFTTAISYTSEPRLLRYQRNHLNLLRKMKMGIVPNAILKHLNDLRNHKDGCVYTAKNPPPTPSEALGAYEDAPDNPCQPKASGKAKALIFEVSFNCEKVAFEVGVEIPWLDIGVFANVEEKFSAAKQNPLTPKDKFLQGQGIVNPDRIPQFGETRGGQVSTFGGGAGVKVGVGALGNELESKSGFYVTGDGKGNLGDVGVKTETSATVGAEVDIGIGEIGVGVEFEGPGASVSFMPSVGD